MNKKLPLVLGSLLVAGTVTPAAAHQAMPVVKKFAGHRAAVSGLPATTAKKPAKKPLLKKPH